MRSISFVICFVLAMSTCFGQGKLDGIGPFKINKSTLAVTEQLGKESGDSIRVYRSDYFMDDGPLRIIELAYNTIDPDNSPVKALACSDARVFMVNRYEVAGVALQNLYLTFKGNLLVNITCDGTTELADALITKYGQVPIKESKKKSICVYRNTGNKLEIYDETYIREWINGTIVGQDIVSSVYDSHCKKQITLLFTLGDKVSYNNLLQCHVNTVAKIKLTKNAQRKAQLKDF